MHLPTSESRQRHSSPLRRVPHDVQDNTAALVQHSYQDYLAASGIHNDNANEDGMDQMEEVQFLLQMNQ